VANKFFDFCAAASSIAFLTTLALIHFGLWPIACSVLLATAAIGFIWYVWYQFRKKASGVEYQNGLKGVVMACLFPIAASFSALFLLLKSVGFLA
jgi:hypothetical protein